MHRANPHERALPVATPRRVKYVRELSQIPGITTGQRARLEPIAGKYAFRANDYYLNLIDWSDPKDPIKQLIIPREDELNDWGELDACNEAAVTVAPGLQHKYSDTALLLCTEVCGAFCRYCFRKRLFMNENGEVSNDVSEGIRYISQHPEISNVLLTGGDPLLMSTRRIRDVIVALRRIPHVRIIRIGSKMPAFNPFRILNDPELQDVLREYSTARNRIYLMCHFDHPRELTREATAGISCLVGAGVVCANQCPIIRGVNDNPDTLAELFNELSYVGCPPYYLFQGRPTAGNQPYEVPLARGFEVFSEAQRRAKSGLARRARFAMSHELGKIGVAGIDDERIYFQFQRAKHPAHEGRFLVCKRDDDAFWLDQLELADGGSPRDYLESLVDQPSPASA